jgi:hypothetical protein
VKFRREGLSGAEMVTVVRGGSGLHPAVDAVIEAVRKPGTPVGNTPPAKHREPPSGTPAAQAPDQGEQLREHPGTPTPSTSGTTCTPLKECSVPSAAPELPTHDGWNDF